MKRNAKIRWEDGLTADLSIFIDKYNNGEISLVVKGNNFTAHLDKENDNGELTTHINKLSPLLYNLSDDDDQTDFIAYKP